MEFAEQFDRFCDFATVAFEPAIVIVQFHLAKVAEHAVEHATG